MSDTEQHKKRKLEEAAEAVDSKQEVAAQESASASGTATSATTTVTAAESDQQQIAREKEKIMKLLEPFSREQLVEILTSAASQYDNIYNEIKTVASADVAHRKVFVRGLAWETTTETLKDAFSTFGEVEEGAVIYDKATSKSKGFGFVTFVDMDAAQRAIAKQTVEIDGRRAACNLAALRPHSDDHHQPSAPHSHQQPHQHQQHQRQQQQQQHSQPHQQPRAAPQQLSAGQAHTVYTTPVANQMYPMVGMQVPMQQQPPPQQQQQHPHYQQQPASGGQSDEADRKLFVRGLSWDTSNDTFRAEFQKFGELEEAMVAIDRKTGKSKGFGFITYKHKASADRALQQPQKTIDGRTTTCNLASQGGSRGGGGNDRQNNSGGGAGNAYPGAMMPVMPASVPAYAVPMYTAMAGPYGAVPPPQMQQQAVQYSAYPAMAADPYNPQAYGAVAAPPQAVQYYQNRPPPAYQQPKPPAPQRK